MHQELWDLADTLHSQGLDWETWFETFRIGANGHNVNNAQALKSSAVWYRQAKNETLHNMSLDRMRALDARNGLPTGISSHHSHGSRNDLLLLPFFVSFFVSVIVIVFVLSVRVNRFS